MYGQQQSEMCFTPTPIRAEWILTFICIILGILCVTTTIILLIISHWRYRVMKHARWLGFAASKYLFTGRTLSSPYATSSSFKFSYFQITFQLRCHYERVNVMVFNTTFNNVSVLLVEETKVLRENHRAVASQ